MFARVLGLLFLVTLAVGGPSPLRKLAPEDDGDSPDAEYFPGDSPDADLTTTEEPPNGRTAECDPTDLDCLPLAPGAIRFISPVLHLATNDSRISGPGAARVVCNEGDSACASMAARVNQFDFPTVPTFNLPATSAGQRIDSCNRDPFAGIIPDFSSCGQTAADEFCRILIPSSIQAAPNGFAIDICPSGFRLGDFSFCFNLCGCFSRIDCQF